MKKPKNEFDRIMVQEIDKIPYDEITKLGQATRYVINKKYKLGLGY